MSTQFDIDLAAAYKAVDERCELICAVADRLLKELSNQVHFSDGRPYVLMTVDIMRLMAELRRVMR